MDYKELVEKLRNNNVENNCHDCALGYYAFEAETAITDLLVRAEAAEKEVARLCESLDFARTKDAEIVRLGQALSKAEERAEKAEKCISEIEDALRFGRYSAAMLRISEYCSQKEE